MIYKCSWRAGHGNVSAEDAYKVMEGIEKRDGKVTAQTFLDESRPEESPTHGCFEWDDAIAAEKYRLDQAQHTILDLVVTVVHDDKQTKVPAFVNVTSKGNAEYVTTNVAYSHVESREIVLLNALRELEAFKRKYKNLTELAEVFKVIDKTVRKKK